MNQETTLKVAFQDLRKALQTSDTEALTEMILDDYRGFTLHGTVEVKDDILLAFQPGEVELSQYEVFEVEFAVFGEIGIVSGRGVVAGSFQEHTFHHEVLFIDIFRKLNGHWRYCKSQVTEISVA
jgi:hypothetical protein